MSIEIGNDVALNEFDRMCSFFRIMTDESKFTADDIKDFNTIKSEIVYAIEQGALVVNEEGQPTYITVDDKEFTFRKPTGKDYMEMDRYKEDQGMHKTFAMTSSLCNVQPKSISSLDGDDAMFMLKVTGFFIGSKKLRLSKLRA